MSTVVFIGSLLLTGLVVGALARLLLPGRDPMSVFQTMLVGVAGSLIAGLITYYAFDRSAGPGILLSILCALVLVYAIRKLRERQLGPAPSRPATSTLGGGQGGAQMSFGFMPGCLIVSLLLSVGLTLLLNLLIQLF